MCEGSRNLVRNRTGDATERLYRLRERTRTVKAEPEPEYTFKPCINKSKVNTTFDERN